MFAFFVSFAYTAPQRLPLGQKIVAEIKRCSVVEWFSKSQEGA